MRRESIQQPPSFYKYQRFLICWLPTRYDISQTLTNIHMHTNLHRRRTCTSMQTGTHFISKIVLLQLWHEFQFCLAEDIKYTVCEHNKTNLFIFMLLWGREGFTIWCHRLFLIFTNSAKKDEILSQTELPLMLDLHFWWGFVVMS